MIKTQFILTHKRQLTHDVYELIYSCPDIGRELPKPGQYALFQLDPWLNRSYSIASFAWDTFTLVIKRIADGKWSPILCDAEIDHVFSGMIPLGHFILRDTQVSKCFIGTGTGFAPLYCQMLGCIENWYRELPITFVFGVRELIDVFYIDEIKKLTNSFSDFNYVSYLSRSDAEWHMRWYVTDWITAGRIVDFQEFYICGSPSMVRDARTKLEALGVGSERVFWEQF